MNKLLLALLCLTLGLGEVHGQAVNSSTQVNVGATKVTVTTPPNDVVAGPTVLNSTGNVGVSAQGSGSVGIDIRGTATGMVFNFQGSVDNTNYVSIPCVVPATGAIVTGGSANGTWTCQAAGYQLVRVNMTALATGSATIVLNASAGSNQPPIGTQGTSSNITAVGGNQVSTTVPVNISGTVPVSIAATVPVSPTPSTSGGLSVYFVQPAASDNHATIKATAGQVYKISATNNSATVNYLRLYNATTGFNGCNSATNLVYENAIPAGTSGAGIVDMWDAGMAFSTGISICITSGYATTDVTSATASAMNVNIGYK